jgi:hypothetical protein
MCFFAKVGSLPSSFLYVIMYLILTYNTAFSSIRSVGDMGDWSFPLRSEVWKFTDDTGAA